MKLLLQTSSSNEDWNGDCDYALVNLTTEEAGHLVELVDRAIRLRAEDSQFLSINYWDRCGLEAYEGDDTFWDDLDEKLEVGFLEAPEGFEPPADKLQRLEGTQVHVADDGVYWLFYPKHSDVRITTAEITYRFLRELAGLAVAT